MTKKEVLKWRLGNLPTVEELRELVKDKIITNEEARDILFNKESEEEADVKALKKQIDFLEGLVKELSKQQHFTTIPLYIERYIEKWQPTLPRIVWTSSTTTDGSLISYSNNLIG